MVVVAAGLLLHSFSPLSSPIFCGLIAFEPSRSWARELSPWLLTEPRSDVRLLRQGVMVRIHGSRVHFSQRSPLARVGELVIFRGYLYRRQSPFLFLLLTSG